MAHVTGIMISSLFHEDELEIVKKELGKITEGTNPFLYIDPHSTGGSKPFRRDLFLASINHINPTKFVKVIKGLKS